MMCTLLNVTSAIHIRVNEFVAHYYLIVRLSFCKSIMLCSNLCFVFIIHVTYKNAEAWLYGNVMETLLAPFISYNKACGSMLVLYTLNITAPVVFPMLKNVINEAF